MLQRTREKNQVHAILIGTLKRRALATAALGAAGRRWLAAQDIPADEPETADAYLRGCDHFDREVT